MRLAFHAELANELGSMNVRVPRAYDHLKTALFATSFWGRLLNMNILVFNVYANVNAKAKREIWM